MENLERINALILRFMEGEEFSEIEIHELREFATAHPDLLKDYTRYYDLWTLAGSQGHTGPDSVKHEWERLRRRLNINKSWKIRYFSGMLRTSRIAASFLLGLGFGFISYYLLQKSQARNQLTQIIEVPLGSRSTISLTDGTRVTLNAGSKLTFGPDFGHKSRNVNLEGEGYFVIAHNPKKVFRVKTENLTVNAYGTVFNVKSYPGEKSVETTLIDGSVSVEMRNKKHSEIFLKPGEQITLYIKEETDKVPEPLISKPVEFPVQEQLILSRGIDTSMYTSWITNRLIIRSEPMQNLAVTLERKYDVNIFFEDQELRDLRFTGTIENETIEQVMAAIKISSSIDFRVDGRNIWLFRQNNQMN